MTPEVLGGYWTSPSPPMAQEPVRPPVRPSGFRALMRNRDYALLWTSQGISLLGDRFHWVAISLWVYYRTGSALSVSYAVIALMLGPAAVGLFAGVLVDRWNRKWTMIIADVIRGALVAIIPRLMLQDIRLVYVDLFLVSCASAFFRPAMLATIPQTVAKSDLMSANSFLTAVDTGTEVVGPILAGVTIQVFSYPSALYVDASTYFVSALLLVRFSVARFTTEHSGSRRSPVFADIKDGFRYILHDRIQLGLLALVLLGWWVSALNSLQTPLAKGVLGLSDQQFGWFNGIWGAGFIVASLCLGWYGSSFPQGRLIAFGFIGWAITTGVAGTSANAGMLFASIFWVGVANIILFISLSTVIMQITPERMLGRVLTTRQVALAAVRVCGMLVFGAMADLTSVRTAVVTMASLSLFGAVLGLYLFPEILRIGEGEARPQGILRESRALGRVLARFDQTFVRGVDTVYAEQPQRTLNATILVVVLAGWGALLFTQLQSSLLIILIVLLAVALKTGQARWAAWYGSKNVRSGPEPRRRRFGQGRRNPLVTGPTSE